MSMPQKLINFVLFTIATIQFSATIAYSQSKGDHELGLMVIVGGRYDNMRLCVATGNGTKGGPIADIMLTGRYGIKDDVSFGVNIPVFRPILFGAAFQLLQFEPELQVEFRSLQKSNHQFAIAPSLGVSLHYGPDYTSDKKNRSPSFFAAGPIIGTHLSIGFTDKSGFTKNSFGIKPFYAALFSENQGTGTVLGAALEYQKLF
jgi:hypothetical protein